MSNSENLNPSGADNSLEGLKQKIDEWQQILQEAGLDVKQFSEVLAGLAGLKDLLDSLSASLASQKTAIDNNAISFVNLAENQQTLSDSLKSLSENVNITAAKAIDYNPIPDKPQAPRVAQETLDMEAVQSGSLSAAFEKLGQTATQAFQGMATAAVLAAQKSQDMQNILDKSYGNALKGISQTETVVSHAQATQLTETESFEKKNLDIQSRYQALEVAGANATSREKKKIMDAEYAAARQGADALTALADLVLENGKKNTEVQKANALIKIGIDTARAISSLVAASNENPANGPTAGVAGVVQFATGLAGIITNIAKAKDILAGSDAPSGGQVPATSTPAVPFISASAPVIQPSKSEIQQTYIDRETTTDRKQVGMVKAYVVESEISEAQKRAAALKSQSMH